MGRVRPEPTQRALTQLWTALSMDGRHAGQGLQWLPFDFEEALRMERVA